VPARALPRAPVACCAVLVLLACGIAGATAARADTRFGDSAWVAPALPGDDSLASKGMRVAPRDHERGWETALRTPFRVVFYPLRLVAMGLESGAGYLGPRYLDPAPTPPPRTGPVVSAAVTLGAMNEIGIGPAVRWRGFPLPAADLRLAGTWSIDDRRRVRISETLWEPRPVGIEWTGGYDHVPNRNYYGVGNDASVERDAHFLLSSRTSELALRVGRSRLRQFRLLGGYSNLAPGHAYNGSPSAEDEFAPSELPYQSQATQEWWYGASASLAALDDGVDPSLGAHALGEVRRAMGAQSDDPDYVQWRLDGRAYLPVFAKRRVIALRAVYAGIDAPGGLATALPFYRLAESEGANRFAGYATGRFRDRQLLLGRLEYRWAILYRMSALAFYETAEVAPRTGVFRLADAHAAWGGGMRLGRLEGAAVRAEFAKGSEGFRFSLLLGSDF
jgi:hypothetical protein